MLTGITLVENQEYTSDLEKDIPEADRTVFLIGAVDVLVRSSIQDNAQAWVQTETGLQMINKNATRNFELCRFGLKGVRNFKDAKGNDIKFETVTRTLGGSDYQIATDKFLSTIDGRVIAELAAKILEINTATDDQRKK